MYGKFYGYLLKDFMIITIPQQSKQGESKQMFLLIDNSLGSSVFSMAGSLSIMSLLMWS